MTVLYRYAKGDFCGISCPKYRFSGISWRWRLGCRPGIILFSTVRSPMSGLWSSRPVIDLKIGWLGRITSRSGSWTRLGGFMFFCRFLLWKEAGCLLIRLFHPGCWSGRERGPFCLILLVAFIGDFLFIFGIFLRGSRWLHWPVGGISPRKIGPVSGRRKGGKWNAAVL